MKRGLAANAAEAKHLERMGEEPCIVTGRPDTVLHHVMKVPGKRCRRDHRYVAPLIPELHNMGPLSVHELGSEELFEQTHKLPFKLADYAMAEWEKTCRIIMGDA
jgi:hypothetical protein